ncbi:polysaccharide pyruvyl transferase family protein [Pseudomonas sp. RL_5y_Pfl2_69]|uniref:polysaccharide pyruvyl transferase family protein n=1 Tax=Pseudomonas sp. RL_5y_Pfl2_69 TaxID=3088711 RepID=UPI0030DD7672
MSPKKIYFAGHNNFGNRGCEALIRSITKLIREKSPHVTFKTPSREISLDSAQWPNSSTEGISFVEANTANSKIVWWDRCRRIIPLIEQFNRPIFKLSDQVIKDIAESDLMIMTGGDNITLDYGLGSLYGITSFVDCAKKHGVPVILWGGSVGPFTNKPHIEKFMRTHLEDYSHISVRESYSKKYLSDLGLSNVSLITDPAFALQPETFDCSNIMPSSDKGVVGINFSPLVRKFRDNEESRKTFDNDIIMFVNWIIEQGYGVVLIPHVGQLNGSDINSDYHYMNGLLGNMSISNQQVKLAPPNLNAAQLKHLISKTRFFIGARTHSTIAALSSCIPTTSIAYSVKALGINRDLFGNIDYILNTQDVSLSTLKTHFTTLVDNESSIKSLLQTKIPKWKKSAELPVDIVCKYLGA